jgi:uncharacterized protein (TIGR04255 family)
LPRPTLGTISYRIVVHFKMLTVGPHFGRPPVVEVVCGVQFSGVDNWQTPHFGSFWEQIRGEYSQFEDHPPLEKLRLQPISSEPQVWTLPPLRRVFFIRPPGNYLIQLQPNRILHNWRKVEDADEYPRYETAYPKFVWSWDQLKLFTARAGLAEPQPDIFELTYINHITRPGAKFPRDVWEFLAFYQQTPSVAVAKESSAMAMHFGWPLQQDMGILTFDLKHGMRATDESDVMLIEFNARGKAAQGGANMDEWFAVAHSAIVNTFDALSTESAHKLWEKRV